MNNYTRSRAKQYQENSEGFGGVKPPDNNRRFIAYIVAAAIVVALVVVIIVAIKSCSAGASTLPAVSPSDTGSSEYTPGNETEPPTVPPSDSAQPEHSASPDPDESTEPGASPTADASTQPDVSASADPTEPANTSGSSGSSELSPGTIMGKPDVDEYLSLRSSASSSSSVLAEIKKDEEFTIIEVSSDKSWLKVKYSDKTGYVPAKYALFGSGDTDKLCTITGSTVIVRSGAGKSNDIIGMLKAGDTLIVTETVKESGETWYKVDIDGTVGYVSAQYCRLAS